MMVTIKIVFILFFIWSIMGGVYKVKSLRNIIPGPTTQTAFGMRWISVDTPIPHTE